MLTKNELKYYSSLQQKKFRIKENKFIAEGLRLVEEGLKSNLRCEIILYTDFFEEKHSAFLTNNPARRSELISESEFRKLSETKNPQGVAAVFEIPRNPNPFYDSSALVALEEISDPGNLGTILRSCVWFGIKEVLLSNGCAEIYNPKTVRSGMGAVFKLNILEPDNFYSTLINLQRKNNYKIITADMEGENLYNYEFPNKSIIVFCNEAGGPSEKLKSLSDWKITIPKFGDIDSLNVSAAASTILSYYQSKRSSSL